MKISKKGYSFLLSLEKAHTEGIHRCLNIMQRASTKSANALNKSLDNKTNVALHEYVTWIEAQMRT